MSWDESDPKTKLAHLVTRARSASLEDGVQALKQRAAEIIDISHAVTAENQASQSELRQALDAAFTQHQALKDVLEKLQAQPDSNALEVARLKKTKLALKDAMARMKTRLLPDIIA